MTKWVPQNDHIKYLEVKKPDLLTDHLRTNASLDQTKIRELLWLGAIHINNKRAERDVLLKTGDILRIHLYPKRYPLNEVKWESQLLYECADFVVLNKPAKIPVPPTVDNIHENVLHAFSNHLKTPLHITQRLDRGTTGILVFAKTKTFQSEYNKLLLENLISKTYLALTEEVVPLGMHTHYISDTTKIPKEVRTLPEQGYKEAKLIVESSRELLYKGHAYYESRIRLLTGRTHQIRAQLAHLGFPLLGDRTYGGNEIEGFTFESFALHAYELKFLEFCFSTPPPWRTSSL